MFDSLQRNVTDTTRYNFIQPDTTWYNLIQPDTTWYNQIQLDTTWYNQIQLDLDPLYIKTVKTKALSHLLNQQAIRLNNQLSQGWMIGGS